MRSGFVSFIGRPNVGKSTLLNSILGKRIAITSDKPQTTRNMIQGIYNDKDTQIVFVDTPGIHKPKSNGGCSVEVYKAKKCSKCGYVEIGDLYATHIYVTCPH